MLMCQRLIISCYDTLGKWGIIYISFGIYTVITWSGLCNFVISSRLCWVLWVLLGSVLSLHICVYWWFVPENGHHNGCHHHGDTKRNSQCLVFHVEGSLQLYHPLIFMFTKHANYHNPWCFRDYILLTHFVCYGSGLNVTGKEA